MFNECQLVELERMDGDIMSGKFVCEICGRENIEVELQKVCKKPSETLLWVFSEL